MQVLVIDMLEGFTRFGPLASARVDALIPQQAAFLSALPHNSLVVFACDEHSPDDFELQRFPPHCLKGTPEAAIRAELLEAVRESNAEIEIVRKHTFSAFFRTNLEEIVDRAPARSWVVIGCATDCCVEANVAELVYRGCAVTVVRDCVDTWLTTSEMVSRAGLSPAHVHDAEAINDHWFERRLPAIWGCRVVASWRELS